MTAEPEATREAIEQPVRDACLRGELDAAAKLALELYGRELLAYLIARAGEQRGDEVLSDLLEDFWRGLPGFGWRCTLRSWLYTLTRHALSRQARSAGRRHETPLETNAAISDVIERIRTETAAHFRTPVKSRFRKLRARLSDDQQTLLILRVDRNLSWRELAVVMSGQDEPPDEEELDRIAARLRQRFQTAKETLRKLAEEEGLLARKDEE